MTVKIPFVVRKVTDGQKILTFDFRNSVGMVLGRFADPKQITMDKEVKRMLLSFLPALLFVGALWLVKYLEEHTGYSLTTFGVLPRTVSGLKGVITSPFVHDDYKHL